MVWVWLLDFVIKSLYFGVIVNQSMDPVSSINYSLLYEEARFWCYGESVDGLSINYSLL